MTPTPTSPPSLKPGAKSSELFVSMFAALSAAVYGFLGDLSETGKLIALAIVAAVAIGYTLSRGKAKSGASS